MMEAMTMPKTYIKKPTTIQALEYIENEEQKVLDFAKGSMLTEFGIYIPTLEGKILARPGDFIIKEAEGECYPCKPSVFKEIYELVK